MRALLQHAKYSEKYNLESLILGHYPPCSHLQRTLFEPMNGGSGVEAEKQNITMGGGGA